MITNLVWHFEKIFSGPGYLVHFVYKRILFKTYIFIEADEKITFVPVCEIFRYFNTLTEYSQRYYWCYNQGVTVSRNRVRFQKPKNSVFVPPKPKPKPENFFSDTETETETENFFFWYRNRNRNRKFFFLTPKPKPKPKNFCWYRNRKKNRKISPKVKKKKFSYRFPQQKWKTSTLFKNILYKKHDSKNIQFKWKNYNINRVKNYYRNYTEGKTETEFFLSDTETETEIFFFWHRNQFKWKEIIFIHNYVNSSGKSII